MVTIPDDTSVTPEGRLKTLTDSVQCANNNNVGMQHHLNGAYVNNWYVGCAPDHSNQGRESKQATRQTRVQGTRELFRTCGCHDLHDITRNPPSPLTPDLYPSWTVLRHLCMMAPLQCLHNRPQGLRNTGLRKQSRTKPPKELLVAFTDNNHPLNTRHLSKHTTRGFSYNQHSTVRHQFATKLYL